jgi:F0F1-type ATP synthase assembly protein I
LKGTLFVFKTTQYKYQAHQARLIIMFLICLLLIGLIAVANIAASESLTAEQAEFIPVPVRDNYTESLRKRYLKQ